MKKSTLIKFINFYTPFLGAGIKVDKHAADFTSFDVSLRMRWWNKNIVGAHFGGSLYAMTDPFFMLILMQNLGKDYIVWDKGAKIDFKKPGKGTLRAHFEIAKEEIQRIKEQADQNYKVEPVFKVDVKDEDGEVIASVEKTLYVRRKDRVPGPKL